MISYIGQDERRCADVIIDKISLRKFGLRIKNLAQSRAFDVAAFDFKGKFIRRRT